MDDSSLRYFITPKGNIVRGILDGGKITNAEYYVNKNISYDTPTKLTSLMKERDDLSCGKLALKSVQRPDFSMFNIPIDAGTADELDVEGGAKKLKGKKKTGGKKKSKMSYSMFGGMPEDIPEDQQFDMEAGKKKPHVSKSKTNYGGSMTPDVYEQEDITGGLSKMMRKSKMAAGAPILSEDRKATNLAELFKQVTAKLAQQTSDIITSGGNPEDLIKSDIKFFNKI